MRRAAENNKSSYAACMATTSTFSFKPDIVYPSLTIPVDYEKRKVWLFRALPDEDNRRASSGLVYDDELESHYSFTNRVINHKRVKPGDLVLLRDNQVLLGAAVVESLNIRPYVHEKLCCPRCGSSKLTLRKRQQDWRCDGPCLKRDGLDPDVRSSANPVVQHEEGMSYTAEFGDTWSDLAGALVASEMPMLSDKWNRQNSIVELNPVKVLRFFDSLRFSLRSQVSVVEGAASQAVQGGFVERTVRARRGQTQFRAQLVQKFGARCAFTGPCYLAALDAAHLYSYADVGEHKDGGGLLMRSDVHRLYDKGLMAVTPKNRVALHEDLLKSQYAKLQDQVLQVPVGREEKMLLAKHYEKHSAHLVAG